MGMVSIDRMNKLLQYQYIGRLGTRRGDKKRVIEITSRTARRRRLPLFAILEAER